MGKTQSKRSVDITTDPKKVGEGEVTGKLEKIEDIDQKKELNGDAGSQENLDAEKKDADESENDKDLTTEKISETAQESNDQSIAETAAAKPEGTVEPAVVTEEISPLTTDDSAKKPKKEKVKKKWSLRNLSFSKKDKQKPAKAEETNEAATAAAAVAPNAEAEKADNTEKETAEVAVAVAAATASTTSEKIETNGDAKEEVPAEEPKVNGQEAKPTVSEIITESVASNDEPVAKTIETTAVKEVITTVISSSIENGIEKCSETVESCPAPATPISEEKAVIKEDFASPEVAAIEKIVSNGVEEHKQIVVAAVDAVVDKMDKMQLAEEKIVESELKSAIFNENNKTIPCPTNDEIEEEPHQNGIKLAEDNEVKVDECERIKSQIEVNNYSTDHLNPIETETETETEITSLNNEPIPTEACAETEIASQVFNEEVLGNKIEIEAISHSDIIENTITNTTTTTITTIVEKSEEESQQTAIDSVSDKQQDFPPPPLPISPPPSQLSAFVFNADDEDDEQTTSDSYPPIPQNLNEIVDSNVDTELMQNVNETFNDKANNLEQEENQTGNAQLENGNIITEETTETNDNWLMTADKDEIAALNAAEVIDEITKTAVEIVQKKLQEAEEYQQQQHSTNGDGHEENSNKQILEYIKSENDTETETNIDTENNEKDCSTTASNLDILETNLIKTLSINDEQLVNPLQETDNAQDLKDNNTAVDIKTQEQLPVTCE